MSIETRLDELRTAQANALAEFYACTKALERADERIRSLNQQLSMLTEMKLEAANDNT